MLKILINRMNENILIIIFNNNIALNSFEEVIITIFWKLNNCRKKCKSVNGLRLDLLDSTLD